MPLWNGFYPDTTQKADEAIGAFDEPQVYLSKGRRLGSIRGDETGAVQAFAYYSRQWLTFRSTILSNVLDLFSWMLVPSVVFNALLGAYTMGLSGFIVLSVFALLSFSFCAFIGYAVYLSPSLTIPVSLKMGLLPFALVLL